MKRFVLVQSALGMQLRNVMYYECDSEDSAHIQIYVDVVRESAVSAGIATWLDNSYVMSGCLVSNIGPGEPGISYPFTLGNFVGTNVGVAFPPQVSLLMRWRAQTLPPNRARQYQGGLASGGYAEGGWAAAVVSAFQGFCNNITTLEAELGNNARRVSARLLATGYLGAFNLVTAYPVDSIPRTQRSRTYGVGI